MAYSVSLEHPWLLAAASLAALPLVLWRRNLGRYRLLASALPPVKAGARLPPLLAAASIALLALSAANPYVKVYREVSVDEAPMDLLSRKPLTLVVVLDVSKSMGYRDVAGGSRLSAAVKALEKLVTSLGKVSNAALLVFSNTSRLVYRGPPSGLEAVLAGLKPNGTYSAVGDAVAAAAAYAKASAEPAVVLVVTDGAWNYGSNPVEAAEALKSEGVPLAFLLVGSDPRASRLVEGLGRVGVKVYYLNTLTASSLEAIASAAAYHLRVEALKSAYGGKVRVSAGEESLAGVAAIAAAVLALLDMLRGA